MSMKRIVIITTFFLTFCFSLSTVFAVETVDYIYDDVGRLILAQYRDGATVTKVIDYYWRLLRVKPSNNVYNFKRC